MIIAAHSHLGLTNRHLVGLETVTQVMSVTQSVTVDPMDGKLSTVER